MTDLKWHQRPEGLVSGEYRIRRITAGPRDRWLLDVDESIAQLRSGGVETASSHATLRGAKAAAHRTERERVLRDTVTGHLGVSVISLVILVTMLTLWGSLVTFAIALAALYVGLRSLTFAISIRLGDAWGWTRDGGLTASPTLSDRVVVAGLVWLRRRSASAVDVPSESAIRVLPPEPYA